MTTRTTPGGQYTGVREKKPIPQTITTDTNCTKFIDFTHIDHETLNDDQTFRKRSIDVDKTICFKTKKRPEIRYTFSWIKKVEQDIVDFFDP